MSYYRTYRPQNIGEIDNLSVREQFMRLLTKEPSALPHAFLFIGPKGTGKTTAARIVAKLFNCPKSTKTKGPCGQCETCLAIANNTHVDVLEIDAASNRGIDEMRTLRERIALTPARAEYKVYIIDEVHMLTTEAFNALLKTLEEPPVHAIFVLATTEPHKIPATILSRCMVIHFNRAKETELIDALRRIVSKEKLSIDEEALATIAQYADGSFRDAVKFLEQASFHKGKVTVRALRSMLSVTEEKIQADFLRKLAGKDAAGAITIIEKIIQEGRDIKAFLVECLNRLEDELVAGMRGENATVWDGNELKDAIRRLSHAYAEMKSSPIVQLPLELAIAEFCHAHASPVPVRSEVKKAVQVEQKDEPAASGELLSLEKLNDHWKDFIAELKPYNHSIAGVLRSSRPKSVTGSTVTIEAFYTFHKDKLSEPKTKDMLSSVLKKLFGEKVTVEIVLGKK